MEDLFSPRTLWIVGGGGLLGLIVSLFWFTGGQIQALRQKAEEERQHLRELMHRTIAVARKLLKLMEPYREHFTEEEARIFRSVEESLHNLSRMKEDSEFRFAEEAFLQVAVAVAMEVASAHRHRFTKQDEQETFAQLLQEWTFLDDALDVAERAYNRAARAHNTWCTLFPFSLVAFWTGARPLPLFEMEGDVESSFRLAYRKAHPSPPEDRG